MRNFNSLKPQIEKKQRIDAYQKSYIADYDFEKTMVWARQKYLTQLIDAIKPNVVIEVGCGDDQLFKKVDGMTEIQEWIIIEPSSIFSAKARKLAENDDRVRVIEGFVEDVVKNYKLPLANLCICSGLLHEIEHPEEVLNAMSNLLDEDGIIHINVPNAFSFHRQLAYEMGIIDSVYQFSNRNIALQQFHIFDLATLMQFVKKANLDVIDEGGYFIKPFAHKQMEKMADILDENVLNGLWKLGVKYPELASEIFINATPKK